MISDEDSDVENARVVSMIQNHRWRTIDRRPKRFFLIGDGEFHLRFRISKMCAWMILDLIQTKIQHATQR